MKKIFFFLAIGIVVAYALFEARLLIAGPQITIISPQDGSATSSSAVIIAGVARNISFLSINNKPSFTDEKGNFSEVLSPAPGYAIFTVEVQDRFGRKASATIHVHVLNYCPIS